MRALLSSFWDMHAGIPAEKSGKAFVTIGNNKFLVLKLRILVNRALVRS
jgi:hypothetical protein